MNITKSRRNNLILLAVIALLIIPQTRKPFQVVLHKGLALFGPSVVKEDRRETVSYSDWELRSLDGETYNFKDAKGKVVFLNFWATWCPPCIAEMPVIKELYGDYHDKVDFLLISNENPETIQKFLSRKGYDMTTYNPISQFPEEFNIGSIPRTFLLDKNGNIVIDKTGAANWNSDKVRSQIDLLIAE